MCHFITAILPQEADTPGLDVIARKHHRQFEPLSNLSIEAQLRLGERYFLTTLGHCDCGTALGASYRNESQESRDHHVGIKQLRARGWTETKIARWLAQKQKVTDRDDRIRSSRNVPRTEDWRNFIEEILESGRTRYLGVLLHWYSGPLSARIQLAGRQVVALRDMTESMLAEMREDVIYEFECARP